ALTGTCAAISRWAKPSPSVYARRPSTARARPKSSVSTTSTRPDLPSTEKSGRVTRTHHLVPGLSLLAYHRSMRCLPRAQGRPGSTPCQARAPRAKLLSRTPSRAPIFSAYDELSRYGAIGVAAGDRRRRRLPRHPAVVEDQGPRLDADRHRGHLQLRRHPLRPPLASRPRGRGPIRAFRPAARQDPPLEPPLPLPLLGPARDDRQKALPLKRRPPPQAQGRARRVFRTEDGMTVVAHEPSGFEGCLVHVEVDIRRGIPAVDLVGLAAGAVKEARERVRAAIRNSGFEFPLDRVL